ncbi:MAG TPA: MFS transporter [Acidimicrobiales bacterium]|nr:MFS transporter [Acidimicrobiales bacterium]
MARVVARTVVDRAGLEDWLRPRTDLLVEEAVGDGSFRERDGPFERYERRVETEPVADEDGSFRVTQTVEFRLALPYFRFLFTPPVRAALGRPGRERAPWWAPPEHLDTGAANALGTLAILAVTFGYLNTLFTQTIPFAGEEFGAGNTAQGVAGSLVRIGGVIALVVVAAADRRGRRKVILGAAGAGCLLAVTGALAPSLGWLTASQMLARAFASALLVLVGIVAAEEMPAGSRAYAVSLLAMAGGLGAGACVTALNLADLGPRGWRLLYVLPLLALPAVASTRHHLRESRRFLTPHSRAPIAGHGGRLLLLGVSAMLANVFMAPYSQFSNRFLRSELGFSGGRIGLFSVVVGTPAAIGIVAGGRIADVRGRRVVAAVALVGGTTCTLGFFSSGGGWPLWVWATIGGVLSAASVPALGVYGPELFPTGLRGKANGLVALTALVGSAIGLTGAGIMSDRFGSIGQAMAVLAAGPIILAVLVLVAYPETARRRLEELNPEDRPPVAGDDPSPDHHVS